MNKPHLTTANQLKEKRIDSVGVWDVIFASEELWSVSVVDGLTVWMKDIDTESEHK